MGRPYHDEGTLRELYCEQDLGIEEIGDKFDVAPSTIWTWLDRHGIETSTWDTPEERFEQNYEIDEETGCWEWTGTQHSHGYGQLTIDYKTTGAHRFSYKLHNGEIPEGAFICHKCHNPPCVNPDHLYAGDAKSNARDSIDNGDWDAPIGERQGQSNLTDEDALEIRERYANEDITYADIQGEYGISAPALSNLINGNTWKHVGGPTDTDTHERMAKRGEDSTNSKLSENEVREIRDRYGSGDVTMAELGSEYGVSASAINYVLKGDNWSHVD